MYYLCYDKKNTVVKRENNTLGRHEEDCSAAAAAIMTEIVKCSQTSLSYSLLFIVITITGHTVYKSSTIILLYTVI